jgi:TusA-related sulfurtransferase
MVGIEDQISAAASPAIDRYTSFRNGLLEVYTVSSGNGSTCAVLTPAIRSKLREMQSGQILEVRVDDTTARGDIEAWCRLSGNELLIVTNDGPVLRFFLKKK